MLLFSVKCFVDSIGLDKVRIRIIQCSAKEAANSPSLLREDPPGRRNWSLAYLRENNVWISHMFTSSASWKYRLCFWNYVKKDNLCSCYYQVKEVGNSTDKLSKNIEQSENASWSLILMIYSTIEKDELKIHPPKKNLSSVQREYEKTSHTFWDGSRSSCSVLAAPAS